MTTVLYLLSLAAVLIATLAWIDAHASEGSW